MLDELPPEDRGIVQRWIDALSQLPGGTPAYAQPVVETLRAAVGGAAVDVNSEEWAQLAIEHQRLAPLTGSINDAWDRFRYIAPEAAHLWRDILQQGWADPKLSDSFDYSCRQAPKPTGQPTDRERLMGEELDKLQALGVTRDFNFGKDLIPGRPHHILKHGMLPKTDEQGHPDGTFRMIVLGDYVSLNEKVPHFRGPSDSDYCQWLEPGHFLSKLDCKKFFYQFKARRTQQQLMLFWHPITGQLRAYNSMTMGIKGGSRAAQLTTSTVCNWAQARMGMSLFPYCDEIASQAKSRMLSFLQQTVLVMVMVWLSMVFDWQKTKLDAPRRDMLFLGIATDTSGPIKVAPSPGRLATLRARAGEILEMFKTGRPVAGTLLRQLVGSARSMGRLHMTVGVMTIKITVAIRQHGLRNGVTRVQFARPVQRSALQWINSEVRWLALEHTAQQWRFGNAKGASASSPHRFVTDASPWGGAAQGLSDELLGLDHHWYYDQVTRAEHHNHQEAVCPLEYLDLVREAGVMGQGDLSRPEVFLALTDNVTVMAMINNHRTKSLSLAKLWARHSPVYHHLNWILTSVYVDKVTMDTKYRVDQKGRIHSTRVDRGLPAELLMMLRSELADLTQEDGILTRETVDLFTSFTVRQSNLYCSAEADTRSPTPLWTDALGPTRSWAPEDNVILDPAWLLHAFPPDAVVVRVLQKIVDDRCPSCLLVSRYGSHVPMGRIEAMQTSPAVFFSIHQDDMIPPEGYDNALQLGGQPVTHFATILSGRYSGSVDSPTVPSPRSSEGGFLNSRTKGFTPIVLPGHGGHVSSTAEAYILSCLGQLTLPSS